MSIAGTVFELRGQKFNVLVEGEGPDVTARARSSAGPTVTGSDRPNWDSALTKPRFSPHG